jgi:hypothetical protein
VPDEFQLLLEPGRAGGSGGPDVFALQLYGAEQIELAQNGAGHAGLENGLGNCRLAVAVIRCKKEECLGKAQIPDLGRFSVHRTMVPLPGSFHNEDLHPRNGNHWPQVKLQSTFNAMVLAE